MIECVAASPVSMPNHGVDRYADGVCRQCSAGIGFSLPNASGRGYLALQLNESIAVEAAEVEDQYRSPIPDFL